MTVPVILGVDISPRRCGWGVARLEDGAPLACGMQTVNLPDPDGMWMGSGDRMRDGLILAQRDISELGDVRVELVYVEEPAKSVPGGGPVAFASGRAFQLCLTLLDAVYPDRPVEILGPTEWRRLAGLPGNCGKDVVYAHSLERLPADGKRAQDAADALCVAMAGWRSNLEINARAEVLAGRGEAA